jgi:hypothetical protein
MISLERNRFVQLVIRFCQSSKLNVTVCAGLEADGRDDIVVSSHRWIRLMLDILS